MTDARNALPVLWIYGPSGVGKTTVGWELFTRLSGEGMPVGYIDIDQIGMCYAAPTAENWAPEASSDRVRYRLKSRSLNAVATRFREAGARGLIVSGVVDPGRGIDVALMPNAEITPYRLRVDRAELQRRLGVRGRPYEPVEEILRDAEELDRSDFPGAVLDTTGLGAADVLGRLSAETSAWPPAPGPSSVGTDGTAAADAPADTAANATAEDAGAGAYGGPVADAPGEILWLCGPTAVGKSTMSWSVYMKSRKAGQHTAFLDLDQIGFARPASAADPGNHRLKAGNLAGVWRNFAASGARRLVVLGPLDKPESAEVYRAAVPGAKLTLCRLGVGRAQLEERIARRGRGESPGIAGDELEGLPQRALHEVAERAWAEAAAFERSGVADVSVDTDGRTAAQVADEILELAGWVHG